MEITKTATGMFRRIEPKTHILACKERIAQLKQLKQNAINEINELELEIGQLKTLGENVDIGEIA